jgi:hypothetical protein
MLFKLNTTTGSIALTLSYINFLKKEIVGIIINFSLKKKLNYILLTDN